MAASQRQKMEGGDCATAKGFGNHMLVTFLAIICHAKV